MTPETWRNRAACQGKDLDQFFNPKSETMALEICSACPVVNECRQDADDYEEMSTAKGLVHGVVGNETPKQRIGRRKMAEQVKLEPVGKRSVPARQRTRARRCRKCGNLLTLKGSLICTDCEESSVKGLDAHLDNHGSPGPVAGDCPQCGDDVEDSDSVFCGVECEERFECQ